MQSFVTLPTEGTVLAGRFMLGREIGRGAVGAVFEAQQLDLERRVAIKILLPEATGIAGLLERFEREAQLAAALVSPHTIRIYAFDVHGSGRPGALPYIVMELLEGETLWDILERQGRLEQAESLALLDQVLRSLEEAHHKGIVHRDVKPDNLFVTRAPRGPHVKVLDFGIAKAVQGELGSLSRRLTATGMIFGTPLYMAPEQVTGAALVTPALDVYGVGCIAYHLLSGAPPYQGENGLAVGLMHLSDPVPRLDGRFANEALAAVVYRCMAKDPAERFADAGELRRALASCMGDEPELDSDAHIPVPTADFPAVVAPDHDDAGVYEGSKTLEWRAAAIEELSERIGQHEPAGPRRTWPNLPQVGREPTPEEAPVVDTFVEMPRASWPDRVEIDERTVDDDWLSTALDPETESDDDSTIDTGIRAVARRITPLISLAVEEFSPTTRAHKEAPVTDPPMPAPTQDYRWLPWAVVVGAFLFMVIAVAVMVAVVWR